MKRKLGMMSVGLVLLCIGSFAAAITQPAALQSVVAPVVLTQTAPDSGLYFEDLSDLKIEARNRLAGANLVQEFSGTNWWLGYFGPEANQPQTIILAMLHRASSQRNEPYYNKWAIRQALENVDGATPMCFTRINNDMMTALFSDMMPGFARP